MKKFVLLSRDLGAFMTIVPPGEASVFLFFIIAFQGLFGKKCAILTWESQMEVTNQDVASNG